MKRFGTRSRKFGTISVKVMEANTIMGLLEG
jgi:hypothetical protein